jgi:3-phosphoshikimate 1-carboxyvinyltransferase
MLCAKVSGWNVEVVGNNADESPYVTMTSELCKVFPANGGEFQIEPDASSASYFHAANAVAPSKNLPPTPIESGFLVGVVPSEVVQYSTIEIAHQPKSGWQVDERYPQISLYLEKSEVSRQRDLGDSIMTAIVLAPITAWSFPPGNQIRFTDLARLRVQECERVIALRTELTKCGAKVFEEGDTLTVHASRPHGAEIETYNDHRMAMCFAVLGLKVPGIKIRNPACVKKTFPNFFQKLAAPPPNGLGVEIRDGRTGRKLGTDELFAE